MHPGGPIGQQIDTALVGPLFLLGQIAGRNGKRPAQAPRPLLAPIETLSFILDISALVFRNFTIVKLPNCFGSYLKPVAFIDMF